ncbi:MAG: TIGR02921 family PEP-CTERM protein [Candidatus Electrothrix sp. MAN1_4]|nr:TIGR02921 family PEP-CTERM protein [Candidatus Electrothrix sp. MAN1_4]
MVSLIVFVPFLSPVIVWYRFRKNVVAALKLFYAVELPLVLLLILRVVLFRDAPLAAQFVFANIAFAIAGYFSMLWYGNTSISRLGKYIDLAVSTVIALVGVYLGLLLGLQFFPIPFSLLSELCQGLFNIKWADVFDVLQGLAKNPFIIVYVLLFFSTFIFFLTTPLVLITAYLHQFIVRWRTTPYPRLLAVVFGVLIFEGVIFSQSYTQPQLVAFDLSEKLPAEEGEQRQLLTEAETLREGLLNGYLASYRYVSSTGSSRSLQHRYSEVFGKESRIADYAQNIFNVLAAPFLYQGGDFDSDKKLAAQRYQEFFDTSIEKGERENILDAVKATWENEQNEAGLMNAASHYVLLKNQSIQIVEQGDIATVTITQVLENQTYQAQEVVFHFALPEDAVATGVWMSDDIDNPQKYQHVVSPRGAAQAVYKAEVARRIDPALLEQVGPLQYRLRVFPIPARSVENRSGNNRYSDSFRNYTVAQTSVQFEYIVCIDENGMWPMPELLEKRNVYWNDQTIRSHQTDSPPSWLPEKITAMSPNTVQPHSAHIADGIIQAVPKDRHYPTGQLPGPVAVIIDGSYSMNMVRNRLDEQLQWLEAERIDFDLFFCQKTCEQTDGNKIKSRVFFGNSQLIEQLSRWTESTGKHYSAIFVLSDAGSYELSPATEVELEIPVQPLWLVHLSDQLPYAYDDKVIDGVNDSGGGIAQTLPQAVEQFLWTGKIGENTDDGKLIGVSTRYFWYWIDETSTAPRNESDLFTALAAGRLIKYLSAESDKSQLKQLDRIHAVAKEFDIVSVYSSMLVLVEDRQRQLLKEAEVGDDRFEREIETERKLWVNLPIHSLCLRSPSLKSGLS